MIEEKLQEILKKAVKKTTGKDVVIDLDYPHEETHGDYACAVAMRLSKELEENPREIASKIVQNIEKNSLVEKVDIAGPGFINLTITNEAYSECLGQLMKEIASEKFGRKEKETEKIIVEYSQPNIAKPLGVHHLLSTIIGQSLANILRFRNYKVTSINYLGDWGTQFGKLIYAYKKWGKKDIIEKNPIPELLKLYVQFHEEAEKNEKLEDFGREEFKKLEGGDKENTKLWEWVRDISLKDIEKTYRKLGGIHFDHYWGEEHVREKTEDVIEDGKKKGLLKEGEEGALMVFFPDEKLPPYMIQKKDGTTLYSTRDLATIREREKMVGNGRILYIVDVAQKLHFEQMFETARLLGYVKKSHPIHVIFGRMEFPEGGMSTRKGKVVLLDSVIDEAVKRAAAKIEEHKSPLLKEEKNTLAEMIGIGAIKYNVLSQNRLKNYTFVWDNMLSFEGNSAPYLQYAFTRTQSLIRKSTEKLSCKPEITKPEEKNLLKEILKFNASLDITLEEYKPNLLCGYLFELAQKFSLLYNNLSILSAENAVERRTRLMLTEAVAYVLKTGLDLLGIQVPEKM